MANRYYTTDELRAIGAGAYHKPYGTLGSHCFFVKTVTPQGVEVVGLPGGETNPTDFSIVDVPEGWTLGYNAGAVWAIRPASLIQNPLRRVLREHHLPWDIVQRTGEPVQITTARAITGLKMGFVVSLAPCKAACNRPQPLGVQRAFQHRV